MSKWRPSTLNCLYVIPDVAGAYDLLQLICDRILPLRKSDGGKDKLIFLGDLIDRHQDSHKVIDLCIELKKKYKDQVVFLRGNHEQMFLKAANKIPGRNISLQDRSHQFGMWKGNGGFQTLMGYLARSGSEDPMKDAMEATYGTLDKIAPLDHFGFLNSTVNYYQQDPFIFVHGGMYPGLPLDQTDPEVFYWDRKLCNAVMNCIEGGKEEDLDWEPVIVTGHNNCPSAPIIHEKFLMLDMGAPKRLPVFELNSMTCMVANPGYDRLVEFAVEKTKKTSKKAGSFRRAAL